MPKVEQQQTLLTDEIIAFLQQSNISAKNIARLQVVEGFEVEEVARQAAVVREISQVKPHKRKRWRFLRKHHPEILQRAVDVGLIPPREDWDESFCASPFEEVDDVRSSSSGFEEVHDDGAYF